MLTNNAAAAERLMHIFKCFAFISGVGAEQSNIFPG